MPFGRTRPGETDADGVSLSVLECDSCCSPTVLSINADASRLEPTFVELDADFAAATAAACAAGEVGCEPFNADANELEKFGGNCPDAAAAAANSEPDACE